VASEPVVVEVEFDAAARAYEAFEQWAGTSNVVVFFEPETVMAVDLPDRRGFLYDKVYFTTVWASAGGDELVDILHRFAEQFVVRDPAEQPQPERTLALVLANGAPIEDVRHLI
jgi:hypothetical protein